MTETPPPRRGTRRGQTAGTDAGPSRRRRPLRTSRRGRPQSPSKAPAVAMSPPRETSTPHPHVRPTRSATRSAASALAVAPRSSSTPGGSRTVPRLSSISTLRHPGTGWGSGSAPSPASGHVGEVAVVAEPAQGRADGGVDRSVGGCRRTERHADRLEEPVAHDDRVATGSVHGATARNRGGTGSPLGRCARARPRGSRWPWPGRGRR